MVTIIVDDDMVVHQIAEPAWVQTLKTEMTNNVKSAQDAATISNKIAEEIKELVTTPLTFVETIPLIHMTETTVTIEPNKMYVWGEVSELAITLSQSTNPNAVSKYMFQFNSGNSATNLYAITGVKWVGGFTTIQYNKIYQAYILNGIGTMLIVDVPIPPITAKQWVEDINVGWNLANSLESTGSYVYTDAIGTDQEAIIYETMWGNPVTTKAMIDVVKAKGFNAVRIPITWAHHLNSSYQISSYWMDRVEEVVNYVLANNMKCIINTHHDHSNYGDGKNWLNCNPSTITTVSTNFTKVWTHIANRFKKYNNNLLIFEAFNELMTNARTWAPATTDEYKALNQLAQTFVDTVRATGGNNSKRILCINTYAAGLSNLEYFKMPTDIEAGYLLAQVHLYENRTNQEVENNLIKLDSYFGSKNIPVIIGECATPVSTNYDMRIMAAKNLVSRAKSHGYKCFVWDSISDYQLLDRTKLTWKYEELVNSYIAGTTSEPITDVYTNIYNYNAINSFTYGALDGKTGLPITFAHGGIYLKDKLQVDPEYQYTLNIKSNDNGFRVNTLFWWDKNENFIGCNYYSGEGVNLTTVKAPYNAKYLNFYIFNPWGTRTLAAFTTSLANGQLFVNVNEVQRNASTVQRLNLSVNLNDFSNWKSGDYDATCGRYVIDNSKISCIGLIECDSSTEYKVQISKDNIGMIIRELDNQGTMVYSHNYCSNGMYLPVSQNTKYLMLVLYNITDENKTFEYFQNEFNNGLKISLIKEVNPKLNTSGYFDINTIDFNNIANYKTGTYNTSNGVYSNLWYKYNQMCISHLIEIKPSTPYSLILSDVYALSVQEFNSSGKYNRNIGTMKNGGVFQSSSTAKYIAVALTFSDNSASRIFKDFFATFKDATFVFNMKICTSKVMTLKNTQGTVGNSISSTGIPYSIGDNNYCSFNSINVTTLTSKEVSLQSNTGGIYLFQYDVNGKCIVSPSKQIIGYETLVLNSNTTSIRFCCTWMNASSTVTFIYSANQEIVYV